LLTRGERPAQTSRMTDEDLAQLNGRIDALVKLCSFLLATHPLADTFIRMFRRTAEKEAASAAQTPNDQAYVKGYVSVDADIQAARDLVRQAEQIRDLKPGEN
jgi:hypothetical protein